MIRRDDATRWRRRRCWRALAMAAVWMSTCNSLAPSRQNRPWIEIQTGSPAGRASACVAMPAEVGRGAHVGHEDEHQRHAQLAAAANPPQRRQRQEHPERGHQQNPPGAGAEEGRAHRRAQRQRFSNPRDGKRDGKQRTDKSRNVAGRALRRHRRGRRSISTMRSASTRAKRANRSANRLEPAERAARSSTSSCRRARRGPFGRRWRRSSRSPRPGWPCRRPNCPPVSRTPSTRRGQATASPAAVPIGAPTMTPNVPNSMTATPRPITPHGADDVDVPSNSRTSIIGRTICPDAVVDRRLRRECTPQLDSTAGMA